jgi:hypothetical protein
MAPKAKAPDGWVVGLHGSLVDLWCSVSLKNQTKMPLKELMNNTYHRAHNPYIANTLVFSSDDIRRYANIKVQNYKRTGIAGPTIKQATIDSVLQHYINTNKFIDELYDKEFSPPIMADSDDDYDDDDASYSVNNSNPEALAGLFEKSLTIKRGGGGRPTRVPQNSKPTLRALRANGANDHGIQIVFGVSPKLSDDGSEFFGALTINIPLLSPNDETKYKLEIVPDPTNPGMTALQLTSPCNSLAWGNDSKLICTVMDYFDKERNKGNPDYINRVNLQNNISATEIQLQLQEELGDTIVQRFKVIDVDGNQVSPHDKCWQTAKYDDLVRQPDKITLKLVPVKINVNNEATLKPVEKAFDKEILGLRFYLVGIVAYGQGSARNMRKSEETAHPDNFLENLVNSAGELEKELSPARRGK